jgi:hypothetical protein
MTDCVVTRPLGDPRRFVLATRLTDDIVPCSRCGSTDGDEGDPAYLVTDQPGAAGKLVCPDCVTSGERATAADYASAGTPTDACVQRGAHGGDCPGDTCTGCAPSRTAPGRICCARDEDAVSAALQELPDLYAALGEPTTSTGGGSTASEAEQDATPQALPPVVAARHLVRSTLVSWARVLEEDFGVRLPDERTIELDTRGTITRRQMDVDAAVRAQRAAGDITERARLAKVAESHRRTIRTLQDERAAGVDVIRALAGHVNDHRPKLLADDRWGPEPELDLARRGHTERGRIFAEDILDVAHRARGLAYPRRVVLRILCSCGARVAVDTDPERYYTCPGCGEYGTLAWWQRREAPPMTNEPMPLAELPEWLLRHHRLAVTLEQLRGWARGERATITAVEQPDGAPNVQGRRRLYDPIAVLAVVREREQRRKRAGARRPA